MKRIVLLVIGFIFCSNFIFAQECNYEKNEVDKFTGQRSILTKALKVNKGIKTSSGLKIDKIEFPEIFGEGKSAEFICKEIIKCFGI